VWDCRASRLGTRRRVADSLKEFVESIKAMVDAVGINHVGIGRDTDLLSSCVVQGTNKAYSGLTGGFFNSVVGEMLSRPKISAQLAAETLAASLTKPRLATPKRHRSHMTCRASRVLDLFIDGMR
jgi:microsomal dipeptidase-like Zn-dependent dipeptidase